MNVAIAILEGWRVDLSPKLVRPAFSEVSCFVLSV